MLRLDALDEGGRRLCFFSTLRSTPRWVEAAKGNEGWVVLLAKDEKGRGEVVGNVNAKGMFSHARWAQGRGLEK